MSTGHLLRASGGRPLRVTVLEPVPRSGGGSEAMSLAIAGALVDAGATLQLLHVSDGDLVARYESLGAVRVQGHLPLFTRRAPLSLFRGVMGLARTLGRLQSDLVLTSHLGFVRQLAAVQMLAGVPSLVHLGLPSVGTGALLRRSYQRMGQGVCPHDGIAAGWTADGWPASRMAVVPNWVDTTRFKPGDRAGARHTLGLRADGLYIAVVGRLSRAKGTLDLIAAFVQVASRHTRARLLLVGPVGDGFEGELAATLDTLPPDARARVERHPATNVPEAWYVAGDVACSASHTETYGLAVAEAMACALPVVATDAGSAQLLLGDAGSCVAVGDVAALAAALDRWLDASEEARSAAGARLRARLQAHDDATGASNAYVELAARTATRK